MARLESSPGNPRIATVDRALRALGRSLVLGVEPASTAELAQIDRHLAMTPAERLAAHRAAHRNVCRLVDVAHRVE